MLSSLFTTKMKLVPRCWPVLRSIQVSNLKICSGVHSFNAQPNKRLERTRHERTSLLSCVGEPLRCSVMPLPSVRSRDAGNIVISSFVVLGVRCIGNLFL